MRIGIIGGGTIARLFLEHIAKGDLGDASVAVILGREGSARTQALAGQHGVKLVTAIEELIAQRPEAVIEAASHESVRAYGERVLDAGIALVVLSAGVMSDDALRGRLEAASLRRRALLHVPSGVSVAWMRLRRR